MPTLIGPGIVASCLAALLWVASGGAPARADAQEEDPSLSVGHTLVCDTAQEVEAVLMAGGADMSERIVAINNQFGKESCNVVNVLYYEGDSAKTILAPAGLVRIIEVDIVGYRSGDSWLRLSRPMEQYAGVLEKGADV